MSVQCRCESFQDISWEIDQLVSPHWEEVGSYSHRFKRSIDYNHYMALEKLGRLLTVTLRESEEGDRLVGYCVGATGLDPHRVYPETGRRVLMCSALVYYVRPDKRGYGRMLMQGFERAAVDRGVGILNQRAKPENNAGAFLAALGYTPVETTYSKLIGRAAVDVSETVAEPA